MTEHRNYNEEAVLNNRPQGENEIIMYQPDSTTKLEVRLEDETVRLNRQQILSLIHISEPTRH